MTESPKLPCGTNTGVKIPPRVGERWLATYDVGGTGTVVFLLDRDSYAGDLPPSALAVLSKYNAAHSPSARGKLVQEAADIVSEIVFEGVPPGDYIAKIGEARVQVYGSTLISVADGETVYATIEFNTEPTVLRVVDKRGDPISGVSVSLYASGYPLWRRSVTDADGLCTITGSSAMEAFAGLQHAELGNLWGVPVKLARGSDKIIEIEFAPDAQLQLRLLDGTVPLENVSCRLNASDNRNVGIAHALTSDAGGNVTFERLGPGTYGVDFEGPGVWKKKITLPIKPEDAPHTIQLRRTGSVRFQVTNSSGQAQEGISIELTSHEFVSSAQTWINEGRIQTSPPAMTTGPNGELAIPNIPHGSYSWKMFSPAGEEHAGMLEVAPGSEELFEVKFL